MPTPLKPVLGNGTTATIKLAALGRFLFDWSLGPAGSPMRQPSLARVDFRDVHGTWGVTYGGRGPIALEPRDQDMAPVSGPWLSSDLVEEQPARNCGVS